MQVQDAFSVPRRALDVEDYIDIARRHKGWIFGPLFAAVVISVVGAFLWPDTYVSTATIKVIPQVVPEAYVQSNVNQAMSDRISAIAQTVVIAGPPPITAHQASSASNPDMSPTKGRAYLDTVMGYMNPRIVCALQLGPCSLVGIDEEESASEVSVWPNPANELVNVASAQGLVRRYRLLDLNGRVVAAGNPAAQRFVIERNGLSPGTYLVELDLEKGRTMRKLMLD